MHGLNHVGREYEKKDNNGRYWIFRGKAGFYLIFFSQTMIDCLYNEGWKCYNISHQNLYKESYTTRETAGLLNVMGKFHSILNNFIGVQSLYRAATN